MNPILRGVSIVGLAMGAGLALAQQPSEVQKGIEKYREAIGEVNPGELWEARGEDLWKQARGPNHVSLQRCDIGLGPGVVKGAYTVLPKYFEDTGKVEDLESRLVHCMVTQQGMDAKAVTAHPFGGGGRKSDLEALVAYVVSESRGMPMRVSLDHPKEREAFEVGKAIFFHRSGPYDFGCTTCHGSDGKRIRLQDLPNLTNPVDAKRAYTTWPAYRVSQGELRTFQWRLQDCFKQQRMPPLEYGSPASIALTMYLAHNANGGIYNGPAVKR